MQPAQPRRTAKACTTCHARKTRCDALSAGQPCTNCREGGFECLLQPRKKRRSKFAVHVSFASTNDTQHTGHRLGGYASHIISNRIRENPIHIQTQSVLTPTPRVAFPEHVMRHQIPHFSFFSRLALVGKTATTTVTTTPAAQQQDDRGLVLPIAPYNASAYGQAHDPQARAVDEEFLRLKGAFTLPPWDVLDDCVATYFSVFHSFFPVVDRPAFLALYRQMPREDLVRSNGSGPSLLLLQAIVFTASAFVSRGQLKEMGFSSRHQARSSLHSRAKYLHQFNWEQDDIATIQALLLMSHDYASMADQRHTWLWAHQAIGLAQGAGLHRHCQPDDNTDLSGRGRPPSRLWSRIWWACLVRDRLIALGTHRPMHINSLDCSVPLPTVADLAEEDDTDDDLATKAIFADFLKLCHYVEGVLSLAYVTEANDASPGADKISHEVALCQSTLANWAANLSPPSRRTETVAVAGASEENISREGSPAPGSIPFLYQTLLHLMHNVVLTTLLQTGGGTYHDQFAGPRVPSTDMQQLARDSTQLLNGLLQRDLIKYCPTQSVTAVMPALIVQFQLMRGTTSGTVQQDATRGFTTCMAAIGALGRTYWHAQFYHDFFQLAAAAGRTAGSQEVRARDKCRNPLNNAKISARGNKNTIETDTTPTAATITPTSPTQADAISPPENIDPTQLSPQPLQPSRPLPEPLVRDINEPPWLPADWIETDINLGVGDDALMAGNPVDDPVPWNDNDMWTVDQASLFNDWLSDDALFQSLFPSA